jgi:hypothetical protein
MQRVEQALALLDASARDVPARYGIVVSLLLDEQHLGPSPDDRGDQLMVSRTVPPER